MAVGLVAVYRSQNPTLLRMKKYIKYKITYQQMPVSKEETGGLDEIEKTLLYENGYLVGREKINPLKDNKKVYLTKDTARLVNYPHGYMVDLPQNVKFDFDYSPLYTHIAPKSSLYTRKAPISRARHSIPPSMPFTVWFTPKSQRESRCR